ncbi:17.8 kDa heat shock protein [Dichanthelium oligosanthes]|uniref:17.8 kDa heat shock protein n=1 Tax=Dichanthelium oligosanthes TaxID=888268 RepID=A0A1E5WH72_9POAL|nr:17.8 kDa heat shock protein [Dichanthelium oligosanthes]
MSLALSRMLLDRFFPDAVGVGEARPPMDWKETRDAHVFRMDVPGLAKDQVAVELVDGRVLRVRGGKWDDEHDAAKDGAAADHGEEKEEKEAEEESGDSAVRWHCRERPGARAFETQFRLPDDAEADEVRAAMADGVLTVTVPKRKGGGKKRHHGGNKPVCCRFWP